MTRVFEQDLNTLICDLIRLVRVGRYSNTLGEPMIVLIEDFYDERTLRDEHDKDLCPNP